MSNLAAVLKQEICRLARKEVRAASEATRKTIARLRAEIAALKKRVKELESQVAHIQSHGASAPVPVLDKSVTIRFSPKAIRAHRKRLGFSAEHYAKLLGVSMQTVYHWEQGKSRPRQAQLQRLAIVRQMGKREAGKQLAAAEAKATQVAKTTKATKKTKKKPSTKKK